MKRYKIMFIVLALFATIISIVYAAWVITSEKDTSPKYDPLLYIKHELNNKSTTYNTSDQYPSTSSLTNIFSDSDYIFNYEYKSFADADYSTYSQGLPHNAGNYKITVNYNTENVVLDYTINKATPTYTVPTNLSCSIGQSLNDIILPTGFSWEQSTSTIINLSGTISDYTLCYTPSDIINYNIVTGIPVSINVSSSQKLVILCSDNQSLTYDKTSKSPVVSIQNSSGTTLSSGYTTTFEYANSGETSYTTGLPTNAGVYSVKINCSGTDYTDADEVIVTFTISKVTVGINWDNLTFTYDGSNKIPTATLTNIIEGDTCNVTITGQQKNAGTYNATAASLSNSNYQLPSSNSAEFIINKANPTVTAWPTIVKSTTSYYGITASTTPTGSHIYAGDNVSLSGGTYATAGSFKFESNNTNKIDLTSSVITSYNGADLTYSRSINVKFVPTDTTNYNELVNAVSATIYAVAGIGSTYYGTVEEALNVATSGIVYILAGETPSIRNNCTVASGVTLLLTNAAGDYTTGYETMTTTSSSGVSLVLFVESSATLTVNGTLLIGASIYNQSVVGKHSVMFNKGTIDLNGTLYAYGYLKGTDSSMINAASGTNVYDVFYMYNYPFPKNANGMYNKNVFPFTAYSFHNISAPIKLYKGAKFSSWIQVYTDTLNAGWYMQKYIVMIGSGGLFELTGDNSDYILKTIDHPASTTSINTSYSAGHQDAKQREVLDIHGSFKDNSVSVSISVIVTVNISTSKNLAMPLGFMKLKMSSGTGTLSTNSYTMLPGSEMEIGEGATLNISSGVKVSLFDTFNDYDEVSYSSGGTPAAWPYSYQKAHSDYYTKNTGKDNFGAQMIVNGTLNVLGSIGGIIKTTSNTGCVILSTNSVTVPKLASCDYPSSSLSTQSTVTVTNVTLNVRMYMYQNSTISSSLTNVAAGTYYSIGVNGKYGFYGTSGTISYNVNGGTGSYSGKNITIGGSGYTITSADLPSSNPTRTYYTFGGWYTDSSYSTPALGTTIYGGIELIAKWNLNTYSISYQDVYDNNFASGNTSTSTNPTTFTYTTNTALSDPTNSNYVFGGWYLDSACTNKVTVINGTNLVSYLNGNTVTLYAKWYQNGTSQYVVNYINSNSNIACPANDTIIASSTYNWNSYALPNMTINDNNYRETVYFGGWYNGSTLVSSINESMFAYNATAGRYELTLEADWIDKNPLSIVYNTLIIDTVYYKPGTTFTVPSLQSKGINLAYGKVLLNWTIDGSQNVTVGQSITLNTQSTLSANILDYVKLTIGSNSYTDVTGNVTSGYVVQCDSNGIATSIASSSNNALSNNMTIYLTVGSTFTAKYAAKDGSTGNGASITNVTPASALSESDTTYTVAGTGDIEITITGEEDSGGCVIKGTPIMLSDGSYVNVEDLSVGDIIKTFDHFTGKLSNSPIAYIYYGEKMFDVIDLFFDNDISITIVDGHGFFDIEANEYIVIDRDNVMNYIGHKFYYVEYKDGQYVTSTIELIDYNYERKVVEAYSILTAYDINHIAAGLLAVSDDIEGLYNIFELDDNMTVDYDKMISDIEIFGLTSYDDWSDFCTIEEFEAFNCKYLLISIGKGLTTYESLVERMLLYTGNSN